MKCRLEKAKRKWVDELPHVLRANQSTPHSSAGDTPFRLKYVIGEMILVEIGELTWRTINLNSINVNDYATQDELDLVEDF